MANSLVTERLRQWEDTGMGNYYRFESNPFWHLEWRDFDTVSFIRTTLRLLGIAIIVQIGLATLLLIVKPNMFWLGTNLLLVALISHLIAINRIDQQAPKRSFFDDARRGSLDFLRLLPVSGHELVIARKLPFWFLRLFGRRSLDADLLNRFWSRRASPDCSNPHIFASRNGRLERNLCARFDFLPARIRKHFAHHDVSAHHNLFVARDSRA
ncbi:MAG: hypothetical protein ACUVTP_06585 [Candidatus Fervidibacter sp.]|uniref:hypothetical protein n=1 Tax=Candidatus Fervidibacter sp. TaxID=3100871 RepID=UPI00404A5E0B